ncbi:MAG: hypothetical protein ACRDV9_05050 [Acidimicrobiia bacterium]
MVASVHQCPECELRFLSDWELSDHLAREHPREADDDDQEQRSA